MTDRNRRDELGPESAGQSGDIQQLSDTANEDSESVEELVEEGNAFEADAVQGVEDADAADRPDLTATTRAAPISRWRAERRLWRASTHACDTA